MCAWWIVHLLFPLWISFANREQHKHSHNILFMYVSFEWCALVNTNIVLHWILVVRPCPVRPCGKINKLAAVCSEKFNKLFGHHWLHSFGRRFARFTIFWKCSLYNVQIHLGQCPYCNTHCFHSINFYSVKHDSIFVSLFFSIIISRFSFFWNYLRLHNQICRCLSNKT